MSKWTSLAIMLLFASSLAVAGGPSPSDALVDLNSQDHVLLSAGFIQAQVKECAKVFPVPDAQATWKNCQEVDSTECGGPPGQCTCRDAERLITYKCEGGTYKSCEYDPGCVNGS
jgi:hypothetical protein